MVTVTPASRATSAAAASVASTSSRGLIAHCRSSGASRRSPCRRCAGTGSYALTSSSFAPTERAKSTAWRTACVAVSEPSVPTTIDLNMIGDHILQTGEPGATSPRLWFRSVIDLHCHVLPGIDDGPESIEGSVALARAAAAAGTRTIVATPHVNARYRNDAATIARLTAELNRSLQAEGVPVNVLAGAEIAITSVVEIDRPQLDGLTLGGGGWLLMEPPFTPIATGLENIV